MSWQYALLLPSCVRPISSPWSSMGMPCDNSRVTRKLRFCRARKLRISGSSVGPSAPQFHERLLLSPSRLSSPFASLCLSLYETRSFNVNPSCAVTKLMLAKGRRPVVSYRSELPDKRYANSLNV